MAITHASPPQAYLKFPRLPHSQCNKGEEPKGKSSAHTLSWRIQYLVTRTTRTKSEELSKAWSAQTINTSGFPPQYFQVVT